MRQVVFWDFDGTLAARDGGWRGALIDALTELIPQHHITAADVGPGLRDGFPWHEPEVGHPQWDTADAWWTALTPLLERAYTQAGVATQDACAAARVVRSRYCDPQRFTIFPDTRPVLEQLRDAGWRHVIVSNHVPELPELIHAIGLGDLVESVVTSAHTGYEKPNPKMFAAALALAGTPERV